MDSVSIYDEFKIFLFFVFYKRYFCHLCRNFYSRYEGYCQVLFIVGDDTTYEREFGNLNAIKDNYPKYVISMTPLVKPDNGIIHINLREFLKNGL